MDNSPPDKNSKLLPAIVVEKNRQGTFAFSPGIQKYGALKQVLPISTHLIAIGDWGLYQETEEDIQNATKLKFNRKMESSEFEKFKIPTTILIGSSAHILAFFVQINGEFDGENQEQNVYIFNVGTGFLSLENHIKIDDDVNLGLFKWDRNSSESSNSNSENKWILMNVLRREPTSEERVTMRENVQKLRKKNQKPIEESEIKEKEIPISRGRFKFGIQNAPKIENVSSNDSSEEESKIPTWKRYDLYSGMDLETTVSPRSSESSGGSLADTVSLKSAEKHEDVASESEFFKKPIEIHKERSIENLAGNSKSPPKMRFGRQTDPLDNPISAQKPLEKEPALKISPMKIGAKKVDQKMPESLEAPLEAPLEESNMPSSYFCLQKPLKGTNPNNLKQNPSDDVQTAQRDVAPSDVPQNHENSLTPLIPIDSGQNSAASETLGPPGPPYHSKESTPVKRAPKTRAQILEAMRSRHEKILLEKLAEPKESTDSKITWKEGDWSCYNEYFKKNHKAYGLPPWKPSFDYGFGDENSIILAQTPLLGNFNNRRQNNAVETEEDEYAEKVEDSEEITNLTYFKRAYYISSNQTARGKADRKAPMSGGFSFGIQKDSRSGIGGAYDLTTNTWRETENPSKHQFLPPHRLLPLEKPRPIEPEDSIFGHIKSWNHEKLFVQRCLSRIGDLAIPSIRVYPSAPMGGFRFGIQNDSRSGIGGAYDLATNTWRETENPSKLHILPLLPLEKPRPTESEDVILAQKQSWNDRQMWNEYRRSRRNRSRIRAQATSHIDAETKKEEPLVEYKRRPYSTRPNANSLRKFGMKREMDWRLGAQEEPPASLHGQMPLTKHRTSSVITPPPSPPDSPDTTFRAPTPSEAPRIRVWTREVRSSDEQSSEGGLPRRLKNSWPKPLETDLPFGPFTPFGI